VKLGVDAALIDGTVVPGDLEVVDGTLAAAGLPAAGTGRVAAPGLVDLQVNGFAGVDLLASDVDGVITAARALHATGVRWWQPTLITAAPHDTVRAAQAIASAAELIASGAAGDAAAILGIHLEGPFLAPGRMGTHPAVHRRAPDLATLEQLLAAGPVTYVTLAPELPGATAVIDRLLRRGVTVALGHTDATADQAHAAFDRGVRTVTHLFNAMRRFTPRDPGVAGAALARPDVIVQCIVDGWHLAPDTVRMIWAAAGGRTALVTDAIAAAGLGDGPCRLGEVEVTVADGAARRADGTLAGSVLTMPDAIRNLVALGIPRSDALRGATEVPARVIGRPEVGRSTVGAPADLVVVSPDGTLERVVRSTTVTEVLT
jgi:N-acetylglucosamine-6-phosphate deacetylase